MKGLAIYLWERFEQLIKLQNRDICPFSLSNKIYWMRRIAVRLQQGVAAAILGRIQTTYNSGIAAGHDGGSGDYDAQCDKMDTYIT